jgi:hypothetical protein
MLGKFSMACETNEAEASPGSGMSEDQRLVRAWRVLAISVLVYLGLACLSAAWLPNYPLVPVVLVAFGAHSAASLFRKELL